MNTTGNKIKSMIAFVFVGVAKKNTWQRARRKFVG
jgi:hypothetical protein